MNNINETLSPTRKRQLWRRVYYSFFLSLILRPALAYGLVFGASVQLFRELVFVRMVVLNFLAVEVGQVPGYLWSTLTSSDSLKLLVLLCIGTSLILFLRSLYRPVVVPGWSRSLA